MSNIAQRSFSAGELAPSLYHRTDTERYHKGLRTCRNFIVRQDGGALNRPGTLFIAEAKDSTVAARFIKFVNESVSYVLELGNQYIRFYTDGARLDGLTVDAWVNATAYSVGHLASDAGVNYYCKVAHTSATATNKPGAGSDWLTYWYALTSAILELPTPWETADLSNIQYVQAGEVVRLVCPGIAVQELTRIPETANSVNTAGNDRWVLAETAISPSISPPSNVTSPSGGSTGVIYYWAVTAIKDGTFEESLAALYSSTNKVPSAATPTIISWGTVVGAVSYNIYRSTDGYTYGYVGSVGAGALSETSDTAWSDNSEAAASSVADVWAVAAGQCRNPLAAISATDRAFDGKYTVKARYRLQSGAGATIIFGRVGLYYKRNTDMTRVFYGYSGVVSLVGASADSGLIATTYEIVVPDDGYTSLEIDLVPEVFPTGGNTCTMTVDATTTPNDEINWMKAAAQFSDDGGTADMAIAQPTALNVLNSTIKYPAVVAHFQQRAVYANTQEKANYILASKVGSKGNFIYATPLQADDPVEIVIESHRVEAVRHLLDLGKLIIFTAVGEWVLEGDEAGLLRPDAINLRKLSFNGANKLSPIVINNRALYVQARGNTVRFLRHDDVEGSMHANLSINSLHLFRGYTVVDWDVSLLPDSTVWAVRSDGTLLGLTYAPETEVISWHRHDTDGVVENVIVIPESDEDRVYLLVRRSINGSTKRYIERMASRQFSDESDAWFVDCGKKYEGAAISTMTDLSHLEGKDVAIFADSDVRASPNNSAYTVRTVSSGEVALGGSYSEVLVGLPYVSDLETLDIDSSEGTTIKGTRRIVTGMTVGLNRTRGLWFGRPALPTGGAPLNGLSPMPLRTGETSTSLASDARDVNIRSTWDNNGRVLLRQVDPLPAEILLVAPDFGVSE